MKKLVKTLAIITAVVSAFAALTAGIAFIAERVDEIKNKGKVLSHKPYGIYERFIKRPLDCFLSTGALIVLSPVLAVTALLVRIKLGSPVLFTQDRPGRNEKIFKLYKFRTMTDKRDENGDLLPDDVRLTKFGKALRATSLDELPELFNIIKGDMAVVGPRPQLVRDMVFMSDEQRKRHMVRQGLTGLAQCNGRNGLAWDDKLQYDIDYIENGITFIGDVKIIYRTVEKVFKKEGITMDNMATAADYGDYLLDIGRVDKEEYDRKQQEAKKYMMG